jgi:CheY-like chemotaxis protein
VLDLSESLKAMEPMLKRLIGEQIEVVVRMPVAVGPVKADPGQIEQVILNLAINARDAMPEGGTLLLELTDVVLDESSAREHVDAVSGPYVLLAVSDTGVGMDAATAARVFEPFFTTKSKDQGTGLGLSTVHGIVKQSGGSIWVYSEPGRGSTFKVYLPRVDAPVDLAAPEEATDLRKGSETVLIAEDEHGVRRLAQRILEQHGYRVLTAATPREAVDIAAVHGFPIHLLLTDVVLPEMSGKVLAEQLASTRAGLRVLYMSGYTDDAIVRAGPIGPRNGFHSEAFHAQRADPQSARGHRPRRTLIVASPASITPLAERINSVSVCPILRSC